MKIRQIIWLVPLVAGCTQSQKPVVEQGETAIPVKLANVETVSYVLPVNTVGTVTSLQESRVAFKMGGVIEKIYVREGQLVKEGQILASLHLDEIDAQVNQAELAFDKATRDFERVGNLLRDSAATMEQFQNVETAREVARENLSMARFNRQYAQIKSPINGTIIRKLMSEGEVVGPGTPVLMLVSNQKKDWVVKVGVSDRDWARLQTGDKAEIELDAYPANVLKGYVSYRSQVADPMTHLYEVEIKLNGNIPDLASGLFARVTLWPSEQTDFLKVPVEALIEGHRQKGYVFVVDQGIAQKRAVTIGLLDKGDILLTDGIDTTDRVVVGGSTFLTDGSSVQVIQE
jgi:multidrug efflux system membrane fusion protein